MTSQNGYYKGNERKIESSPMFMPLFSKEAEESTLGSMLIDPSCIPSVFETVTPKSFFVERHQWIAEAIFQLSDGKAAFIDTVDLSDYLQRSNRLDEIGGISYLVDLVNNTPTSINAVRYAKITAEYYTRRQMLAALQRGVESVMDLDRDLVEVVDSIEHDILAVNVQNQKNPYKHISDVLPKVLDSAEEAAKSGTGMVGIPTGFAMLDRMLGGLRKGHYVLFSGATGMGKTAFALSIMGNIARLGRKVGIFSLEMSDEELAGRLLSAESAIDSTNIINGRLKDDDWNILLAASNTLQERGIYIDDTPSIGVAELRSKARRMVFEEGCDVIMIDYIQLMDSPGETKGMNREQQIATISRKLKALARELRVPVAVLAQINQEVDNRSDKRPMLGDVRESKAPSHDADEVMFVYRDDYYNEESDKQNIADILLRKSRHGATGTVSLYFRKELTQFRDLEIQREDLDDILERSLKRTNGVPTY